MDVKLDNINDDSIETFVDGQNNQNDVEECDKRL